MSFLQFLVHENKLTLKQAEKIGEEQAKSGLRLEEIVLRDKLLPEGELFELKSRFSEYPLEQKAPEGIDSRILNLIPFETAQQYQIVALAQDGKKMKVGMVYPEDLQAQEALRFLSRQHGFQLEIVLIPLSVFKHLLNYYQTAEREVKEALSSLEEELEKESTKKMRLEKNVGEKVITEAPVIKMVAVILREGVEGKASDIHIEPTSQKLRIRFRVDGILYSSIFLPSQVQAAIVARIKILAHLRIDETRIPQDGRFSTYYRDRRIDFRVATFPTTLGEKVAIRILDPQQAHQDLSKLGLLEGQETLLQKATELPFGLILATGPTGSGKTTTLYSLLRILNDNEVNIVTLEDPVEYYIEGVNQSQIRPEIDYTFNRGLRQVVRQDPDIIMVGEIRDEETVSLANHASLTGHLVLSTLHTNDAVGAVPRLIDMGLPAFLIGPSLKIIIAQRLVRKLCPHCRKKVQPNAAEKKLIIEQIDSLPPSVREKITLPSPLYVWRPVGCSKCGKSGYRGRIGVFEVLEMTDRLASLIVSQPTEKKLEEEARMQEMVTMAQAGMLKVINGETSLAEVLRVTDIHL
jgi:type IV pilus assembly protein PilB